jgi:hypothetical protein
MCPYRGAESETSDLPNCSVVLSGYCLTYSVGNLWEKWVDADPVNRCGESRRFHVPTRHSAVQASVNCVLGPSVYSDGLFHYLLFT